MMIQMIIVVQLGPSFKSKSQDQSGTIKCLLTTITHHHPHQTFEKVLGLVGGSTLIQTAELTSPIVWTQTKFRSQNFFPTQYLLGPNIFFDTKFFSYRIFFDTKICKSEIFSDAKFFLTKNVLTQNFFYQKIFLDTKFFWKQNFLDLISFGTTIFFQTHNFFRNFFFSNSLSFSNTKLFDAKILSDLQCDQCGESNIGDHYNSRIKLKGAVRK